MVTSLRVPRTVWWIVWFSFLAGLVIVTLMIELNPESSIPAWLRPAPLLPLLASVLVRWFVYPRSRSQQQRLVNMIIGCQLVEFGALLARVIPFATPVGFLGYALPVLLLYCPYFLKPGSEHSWNAEANAVTGESTGEGQESSGE